MRTPTPYAATFAGLVIALGSVAAAADPDPMQLLRDSANAVAAAPSASVDLTVATKLVRDDMEDDMSAHFVYRTAPDGRFEFLSVTEEGGPSKTGYRVAGNGEVVLTALLSRRRHMLEPDVDGVAAFIRSPGAMGIGSGLGGLALAVLNPTAVDELSESVLESEYLGEEDVDGEKLLHARYTVNGGVVTDIWFAADGKPLVRRIVPNVLETPGVQQMAKRFKKFDYRLSFEFNHWNTEAGLAKSDIQVVEPTNSLLQTSLYEMPEPGPHALLGKAAPKFELDTTTGDRVNVGDAKETKGAVLLEFWATTCPACVQAMPQLEKLHEKYADKGLAYYAVNVGEEPETVEAFLKRSGLKPTVLLDPETSVAEAYDVSSIPLILLVGSDGKVQAAQEGFYPDSPEKLGAQIEATLRGEDVAAAQLEAAQAAEAERMAQRDRLRAKLDG